MKTKIKPNSPAITRVEVLVIVAAIALLAVVLLPMVLPKKARSRATRIECVNNLKQIGLSFRIWSGDHIDSYPMRVSLTNGGTLELVRRGAAWPHVFVLSNELNTPKVLVCPADVNRLSATNWHQLRDANVSYFLGVDAVEVQPTMLLAGDSNLEVDSKPVRSGILDLWTNSSVGWTAERHIRCGNVAMADGSAWQFSNAKLREALANTGVATNRLAIP